MTLQTIDDLKQYLRDQQMGNLKAGRRSAPPVLLLGSGASAEAGIKPMRELMPAAFGCTTFEEFCARIGPMTQGERFCRLFEYLQTAGQDTFRVTPGYRALGRLVWEMYFDIILTTNFDPLLEDALAAADMRRKDYLLLVNPVVHPRWFEPLLAEIVPRVKVVKLHGDLFHRTMAWTPAEMESYLRQLGPKLEPTFAARDLMVVGHSLADSERIKRLAKAVLARGRAIWFVNVGHPPDYLASDEHVHAVTGEQGRFEAFFPALARLLGASLSGVPRERAAPRAQKAERTLDDVMSAVVGIAAGKDEPQFTGFVLRQPRLIVTDGYAMRAAGVTDEATVIASGGRRFRARVLKHVRSYPFGPALLEAPRDLTVSGLSIETRRPTRNLAVRVGVAAGTRVGVSSGFVRDAAERSLRIEPLPRPVGRLIELECAVAPGSCGAPVVDSRFAVRGYVVAGSSDLDEPKSFMHPAHRWAVHLKKPGAS